MGIGGSVSAQFTPHRRETGDVEDGFVHLPKEAGWLAEYLHELTVFPNGKHDDQVDSTAQMIDWFKQAGRGPSSNAGIWQLYKHLAEGLRGYVLGLVHEPQQSRGPADRELSRPSGQRNHCEGHLLDAGRGSGLTGI